jgi:hypothetical protein
MDFESIKADIEIIDKVITQWQRTGRLNEIERAFILDKLHEVEAAIGGNAECKMQNAECTMQNTELEEQEVVSEPQEAENLQEPEEPEVHEELEVQQEPEVAEEPVREEHHSIEYAPRRGKLDRKAIRSLYDEEEGDDNAECTMQNAECEIRNAELEVQEEVEVTVLEVDEVPEAPEVPVQEEVKVSVQESEEASKKAAGIGRVSDIRKAIGINDRYLMIRDLFGGDAAAFDEAVVRLNGFDDLNDAMLFIHDTYRWDNNSDASKLMVDVLVRKLM